MNKPLLDLVRERIQVRLNEAHSSAILSRIGMWLGVFENDVAWSKPAGIRQYGDVAEAAIAMAIQDDDEAKKYFQDGIGWLQKRRFFVPEQPISLEGDPFACVALAIGVKTLPNNEAQLWLEEFIEKSLSNEHDQQRIELFHLALSIVKGDTASWENVSPLLAVSCAHKLQRQVPPKYYPKAQETVLQPEGPNVEWSIFYESAYREIFAMQASIDVIHPTISHVGDLLRGVPAALKRWTWEDKAKTKNRNVTAQRWDIQHEYHVQSLVWAILRPIFPGLEDEENLPSLGHKHPRADILIPGLRLVIEVKYLRDATQSARANLIEEVAADTAIYRTADSGYNFIIAFIWDNTNSSHHHAELESGIRKLNGIEDVVIVSRPGEWANTNEFSNEN